MMNYYFNTEKMSVGYHGQPLIETIGIMLEKGEILTLSGPNGAGKSTEKMWGKCPARSCQRTWPLF